MIEKDEMEIEDGKCLVETCIIVVSGIKFL